MISIKNLSKKYGQKKVLDSIDLEFEAGKVYGIVGENGAGKTTLFKCIAGLEHHSGEIHSQYESLKNHLGYLETAPHIMSLITGWEYLKFVSQAKNIEIENFEEQNIFNLPLNQYASTYSTGMKKKLALMAVLLCKNDILILDEPFNGVDIQSNMIIIEIIEELKKRKKTILISSHIFSTLSKTCDEIILLSKGKILKCASKEDYAYIENEMKEKAIGENLKKLDLD